MREERSAVETLHSPDSVDELLAAYDRESARWEFEKTSSFWDAVAIAHRMGRLGQGRRIAVVDDGFDRSIPALVGQHLAWRQPPGTALKHGTAVALLIHEVAPRATLSLYPVRTEAGYIDATLVADVLAQIARSDDVSIVNLSIGMYHRPEEVLIPASSAGEYVRRLFENRMPVRTEHLPLCAAARAVVDSGKLVLAAVGNSRQVVYSPAIDDSVVACGFQIAEADLGRDGTEYSLARSPSYEQGLFNLDFSLEQPAKALGSSFAAPLLAGFAALMIEPLSFREFARVHRLASLGDFTWQNVRDLAPSAAATSPRVAATLQSAHEAFREAMKACPHLHYREERPEPCPECSLFCELCYLNWALLRMKYSDLKGAELLLRTARAFAPNNAKAAANLGFLLMMNAKQLHERGSGEADLRNALSEAREHYAQAVALRPAWQPYRLRLEELDQLLAMT